jgi:hypothetical protein
MATIAEKLDAIVAFIQEYDDEASQLQQHEQQEGEEVRGCPSQSNNSSSSNKNDTADASSSPLLQNLDPLSHAKCEEIARKIKQRVSGMQLEIESATVQIELLHALRSSEEANHIVSMKALREKQQQILHDVQLKHDEAIHEQTKTNNSLSAQHKALTKKHSSLKLRLERIISNEREAIKKIKEEGTKELEKVKAHFLYIEKNDFKKKEPKLIVKIKLEAAKMIEAKLQRLKDKHNDELGKLKRDADLEIKNYKLELYRNMQHIYKKQRRSHEQVEKQLIDKLERELSSKLEDCREENRRELAILKRSQEQSMHSIRAQHELDKKRHIQQHEVDLLEAKTLSESSLAQHRSRHDNEVKVLEDKLHGEISARKASAQMEFEEWKQKRIAMIQEEEDSKVQREYQRLEQIIKKDIEMCRSKVVDSI